MYQECLISYLMVSDQFQEMALVPTGKEENEYKRIGWIMIREHNGSGMEEARMKIA